MKPHLSPESLVTRLSTSEKLKIIRFWAASTISAGHDPALFSYLADHVLYWGLICCLTLFCLSALTWQQIDWLLGQEAPCWALRFPAALAKASSGHNEFPMLQLQPNLSCMQ